MTAQKKQRRNINLLFMRIMTLLLVLWLCSVSCFAGDEVFIRVDRDDFDAWSGELDNVRFLEDEGMSASAQFSEGQFHDLAAALRERSGEVWIVDCRLETHGFINGIAVSWCGEDNGANLGKTLEEIEAEEKALSDLKGSRIMAYTAENDQPREGKEFSVETWETERGLVTAEGFNYLRLACPDHCWPPASVIDAFIDFARDLKPEDWLHFHCQAGSGRTGAFMTIYEIMQKPDTPVEEILQHQADTGSGNLLKRADPEKSYEQKERSVMVRAIYRYINENRADNYELKWSDWLRTHSIIVSMAKGADLENEGFSSDTLVVNDELEAIDEGRAAVLIDDDIYFITVD